MLTDKDITEIMDRGDVVEGNRFLPYAYARAIEAKIEAKLREQEPVKVDWPYYHHSGMCCGLEDLGIIDRYQAMKYGWDCAIEAMQERISEDLFEHPAPIPEGSKTCSRDTDRLNFLDRNLKFKMGWQVGQAPAGNISVTAVIMGGKNIREAIDTLMLAAARSVE